MISAELRPELCRYLGAILTKGKEALAKCDVRLLPKHFSTYPHRDLFSVFVVEKSTSLPNIKTLAHFIDIDAVGGKDYVQQLAIQSVSPNEIPALTEAVFLSYCNRECSRLFKDGTDAIVTHNPQKLPNILAELIALNSARNQARDSTLHHYQSSLNTRLNED